MLLDGNGVQRNANIATLFLASTDIPTENLWATCNRNMCSIGAKMVLNSHVLPDELCTNHILFLPPSTGGDQ